ncbi:hypothetical protein FOZ63_021524, partial [Perkinsus olseni]
PGRPGPPNSCFYLRKNNTVVNGGVMLFPNTVQQSPVSLELFVVKDPNTKKTVDVGIWGAGHARYVVDLLMGIKLTLVYSIPSCLKKSGHPVPGGMEAGISSHLTATVNFPNYGKLTCGRYSTVNAFAATTAKKTDRTLDRINLGCYSYTAYFYELDFKVGVVRGHTW